MSTQVHRPRTHIEHVVAGIEGTLAVFPDPRTEEDDSAIRDAAGFLFTAMVLVIVIWPELWTLWVVVSIWGLAGFVGWLAFPRPTEVTLEGDFLCVQTTNAGRRRRQLYSLFRIKKLAVERPLPGSLDAVLAELELVDGTWVQIPLGLNVERALAVAADVDRWLQTAGRPSTCRAS
jgi:hypothetical protein